MHSQVLGGRGEKGPAHPRGCRAALPSWALSACHILQAPTRHRVPEHSFSLSCFFLHPEVQVEASTRGKPSKQKFMVILPRISSVFAPKQESKIRHLWVGAVKQCSRTSQPASFYHPNNFLSTGRRGVRATQSSAFYSYNDSSVLANILHYFSVVPWPLCS